jgi:hypothetical protein
MQVVDSLRDWSWDVCLGILAVAGVLLAVPLARGDLDRVVVLPNWLFLLLALLGTTLAVIGLVALVVLILTRLLAKDSTWCEFRPVSRSNAKEVRELMSDAFGDESPTAKRMLDWQRRNGAVMTAVYIKKLVRGKTSRKLVGVFKIVPVKQEAIPFLEREEISGATFPPEFVAGPDEAAAGLYIGDVLAVTSRAKGDLLRQLISALKRQGHTGIPLYTRPLTDHGARLVKKYDFRPVAADLVVGSIGRIHKLAASPANI